MWLPEQYEQTDRQLHNSIKIQLQTKKRYSWSRRRIARQIDDRTSKLWTWTIRSRYEFYRRKVPALFRQLHGLHTGFEPCQAKTWLDDPIPGVWIWVCLKFGCLPILRVRSALTYCPSITNVSPQSSRHVNISGYTIITTFILLADRLGVLGTLCTVSSNPKN